MHTIQVISATFPLGFQNVVMRARNGSLHDGLGRGLGGVIEAPEPRKATSETRYYVISCDELLQFSCTQFFRR